MMATGIAETIGQKVFRVETDQRWWYFRFVVAAIILTAAFMKSWELATLPVLGEGILKSRWLNMIAVELELAFGVWLLSGLMLRLAWLASVASFVFFGLVSFYKAAILQETSCGCFGAAQISPWLTFVMDIGIVALLIAFRPTIVVIHWKVFTREFYRVWRSKQVIAVVIVYLVLAVPATYAMMSVQKNDLAELGMEFTGADGKKTILLEPEKWVGKEFKLGEYITANSESSLSFYEMYGDKEDYYVLVFDANCDACVKHLEDYLSFIATNNNMKDSYFVALNISITPFENDKNKNWDNVDFFQLTGNCTWIAALPVCLHVQKGVVKKEINKSLF